MRHLTAFGHVRDLQSLLHTYQALTSALGTSFSLVAAASEHLHVQAQSLARTLGVNARIVSDEDPDALARLLNNGDPVLLIPRCDPVAFLGVVPALDLLQSKEELLSVGGVMWDQCGRALTGAYVAQEIHGQQSPLLVGIEMSDEPWVACGPFALAHIVAPTTFSVIRENQVTPQMCLDLSAAGCAIAHSSIATKQSGFTSIVFSGLNVLVQDPVVAHAPTTGDLETLPTAVFDSWSRSGIQEIRVLHTSFAVLDNQQQRVLHVGDQMVRAVDGGIIVEAAHPSETLLSSSVVRQLGPGFELARALGQSSPGRPVGSQTHWASYDHKVVALARRVDSLLPYRLRELIRRLLRKHS